MFEDETYDDQVVEETPAVPEQDAPAEPESPAEQPEAGKDEAKQVIYTLIAPDDREYSTPDKVEANHLNRTRGYKFAK